MWRSFAAAMAVIASIAWVGCGSKPKPAVDAPPDPTTEEARHTYPNLEALYAGERGIYRTCGPNNAVCHNSKEFPNQATLGSLVENIDKPCNPKRVKPTEIHDLCERQGDLFQAGAGDGVEIAYVINDDEAARGDDSRSWTIVLREAPGDVSARPLRVVRAGDSGIELASMDDVTASLSEMNVSLKLPENDDGAAIAKILSGAGVPGDPQAIQLGDANRNGVFGAGLGGRLIKPGDPEKSYLFKRLYDAEAGPLMPLANCCSWTKVAVRAYWCWVAGLAPDGANALDAIPYDKCPRAPPDTMTYPEPGPQCASSGLCPVQPKAALGDEATFANLFQGLFRPTCATCHAAKNPAAGLTLAESDAAYASLVDGGRVVPGDPERSVLYQRTAPSLCGDKCMPKGTNGVDEKAIRLIEAWIQSGAPK